MIHSFPKSISMKIENLESTFSKTLKNKTLKIFLLNIPCTFCNN